MHIGIDASRIATTERTGTERYSYELIAALARCDRRTCYTLFCNGLPAVLPPLGTNFALCNIPAPRLWTHARLGLSALRRHLDTLFIPAHVLPLFHPRHSIVTLHDLGYLAFPAAHTARRRLELHLSTLWSARAARHLIAISQATKDDLVRRYRVAPEKISVVYHGLSRQFRPIDDAAALAATRARYRIGSNYLLYVGTIQPRKNLLRLIEAFAQSIARRHIPGDVQLVLAGKRGWLTERIEQRATELGIDDRVSFIGYVADADLPALISGALAFVFPSLYEGFGMPVLEAMACGAPVLTSNSSSLPEVAGDAALIVDPRDSAALAAALSRLANDAGLRSDLRARGLARAALFTWERCAQQTMAVLGC